VKRTIGMDVHRDFAEVVEKRDGRRRRIGRVATSKDAMDAFAATLGPDDHVVLESTSFAWPVAEMLGRHAGKVTVSNPMKTKAIASAKVKTDKVDAGVLADLGDADLLAPVWVPDPATLAMRRRVMHRQQLVRHRTRTKVQIISTLHRNLIKPPVTDVFGTKGRQWLAEHELPMHDRIQVDSLLRIYDVLDAEARLVDVELAGVVLDTPAARLLMSIPGVGPTTAVGFLALIGDISRFATPRNLVGYLGLDPRVRQSGNGPYKTGRISKEGSTHARTLLIEAAHATVKSPGPMRSYYQRLKARKGTQIAVCAVARKLAVITWHMLTTGETYRYAMPSLTARKLADLERLTGRERTVIDHSYKHRAQERALVEQAERAYQSQVRARASHRGHDTNQVSPKATNHSATGSQSSTPALRGRARSRPHPQD
jgi:transposase